MKDSKIKELAPMEGPYELPEGMVLQLLQEATIFNQQSGVAQATQNAMKARVEGFLADKLIPEGCKWHLSPDFKIVFFAKD